MTEWLILASIIGGTIIILFVILAWFGRDRHVRHTRVGFFVERERFEQEEAPDVDQD